MSEQDVKPNGDESDGQNDANKPGGEQGGSNDDSQGGFKAITSQADLDRIIGNRLTRERDSLRKTLKEELDADIRAEEAKKQGDFKKLYEDLDERYKALESSLAERDLNDLKRTIATDEGLPADLALRLQGDDEDALRTDAKALAKHLKAKDPGDTDAGDRTKPGQKNSDKKAFSDPARWGLPGAKR